MQQGGKYYAMINGKRVGPATQEELLEMGLKENHYVWKNGLEQWLPARQMEDFKGIFETEIIPPPPEEAFEETYDNKAVTNLKNKKYKFFGSNKQKDSNKPLNKKLKIGLWLLAFAVVFSIWFSFQGMFLLCHVSQYAHEIAIREICVLGTVFIGLIGVIYFIFFYLKDRDKKQLFITIAILIFSLFPTIRYFMIYDGSGSFDYKLIALTERSNGISLYDKFGRKVNYIDGNSERLYKQNNSNIYIILKEGTAYLYDMRDLLGKYKIETSQKGGNGFNIPSIALKEFFSWEPILVGGYFPNVYIRIIGNPPRESEESQMAEDDITEEEHSSSSESDNNESYSDESEGTHNHNHDSETNRYQPQRHETIVPVQVWKQCMSCLGTGKCNWCFGQGVISDYTGTHDCASCIDGRCGICAGQGGHYETEYQTRVDYY